MAVATAVAVGTMAVGAYSANRQSSAANRATRAQQDAQAQQMEFAREGLDWNKERYGEWRELFMPMLQELQDEAGRERTPDYGVIAADVGSAFDSSQDINRRTMMRYGMQPGDGAMQQAEVSYGLGRARAMVDARNKARLSMRDDRFNRMSQVYGMGNTMLSSALGGINSGYGNAMGAAGNAAGMYGQQAATHGAGAAAGMQMMMSGANSLANQYGGAGGGAGG